MAHYSGLQLDVMQNLLGIRSTAGSVSNGKNFRLRIRFLKA